ncbi:MAG: twin-arginine translocase TatA/TatE family subunit [Deltaproteobacteria bacterium]|nr:twin-arginine translocase TatA/TatE family subunit [Deltaproteobacteria bacterium]
MLGVGFTEILVVLLIAFLFVGPKRLAEMSHEVGKWVGKLRAEFKTVKETQFKNWDNAPFYEPKVEMNQSLEELKRKEKSKDSNSN